MTNSNYYVGWGKDSQLGGGVGFGYHDDKAFHDVIIPLGILFQPNDAKRMWQLFQDYLGAFISNGDLTNLKQLISNIYNSDVNFADLTADDSFNFFNAADFPFYNYTYDGASSAYYPYQSQTGTEATLSPIPLNRAVCGKGVLITFELTSDTTGGTFTPILNGYPQADLGIQPQNIVSGTNRYSFFASINADTDTKQNVGMGLHLQDFKGTLKMNNLLIYQDAPFVSYYNAYNDLMRYLNSFAGKNIDILQGDVFDKLQAWLVAKTTFNTAIQNNLNNKDESLNSKLKDTNKIVADVAANATVMNPSKLKSGSVSAFGDMNYAEIQTEAQNLNLNTIVVSLLVDVKDANDSNPYVPQDAWDKAKKDCENLQKLGFNVILQPYPFINNGAIAEVDWNPSDPTQFFASYTKIMSDIATYAESQKLYGIFVATNLTHLEPFEDEWCTLINQTIKPSYHGKLFFRTNWWKTASWDQSTIDAYNATLNRKFWNYVDVISIAAYFEVTDEDNPTSEQLQQELHSTEIYARHQNIVAEIQAFNTKWHKPIFFGELGIPPYSDACKQPYQAQMDSMGKYNEAVQSNWFDAWYTVFSQFDWWLGYSIFTIGDKSSPYNPYGREAATLIRMQTFGGDARPAVFIDQNTPNIPSKGDVWFVSDASNNITGVKQWDGNEWQTFTFKLGDANG